MFFPVRGNVIKLGIQALILEETLLKKWFLPSHLPKTFKSFRKGVFPLTEKSLSEDSLKINNYE